MAFTEFFCQTTASNLNAGSTQSDNAVYTGVGDSDGTSVFTPSDGSTPASTVSVGDFASVYVTVGATVAVFVGRVTIVAAGVNGAITVSTTAKSGTFPTASAGAHTITCKTGGAWKGPNAAVGFPFNFVTSTMSNAAADQVRVNFLAGVNYAITAAMTHTLAGPVVFEGYTSAAGDGSRATIDGGNPGTSFVLLTISGANNVFEDLIFADNGTAGTGTAAGVVNSSTIVTFRRCVFHDTRGAGVTMGNSSQAVECEAYGCNVSNTASVGGFNQNGASGTCLRCYSHGNTGSNNAGFAMGGSGGVLSDCVADGNQFGVNLTGGGPYTLRNVDTYNNASHGIQVGANNNNANVYVENGSHCNNGGAGVAGTGTGTKGGYLVNCAFGSGTAVNTSGQTSGLGGIRSVGAITLPSNLTPWSAPSTGNFSITLTQCKGTGRGNFTETGSSKSGTVGFPDVGAAQHAESPGGGPIIGSVIVRSTRGTV